MMKVDREHGPPAVHRAVAAHRQRSTRRSRRSSPATRSSRASAASATSRSASRRQRRALRGQLRRPVHVGHDPAGDDVLRQHPLRPDRRGRRAADLERRDLGRRRAGVHPVLPPVLEAAHAAGLDDRRRSSRASPRSSGSSSCSTPTEQSPERRRHRRPTPVRGRVEFDDVHFSYDPDKPLIEGLDVVAEPGQTVAIVGPDRRRQDHARQPAHAVLRARRRHDHARRPRHRHDPAARAALGHRHGAAGHVAVRRHDPRQPRLRQPGRHRGADPAKRRASPTSTASCTRCPTATTPCSTTRATTSRPARSSCSRSPGRSSPTRRS